MIDKIKMRQWAINVATIIRDYPDLYCLIKRGYERLTGDSDSNEVKSLINGWNWSTYLLYFYMDGFSQGTLPHSTFAKTWNNS